MKTSSQGILPKGFVVNDLYTILLFVKKGSNAETYRVKSKNGKIYSLKLFDDSNLNQSSLNENDLITEIEILKLISHPNIISYQDSGELIYAEKKHSFLVVDFIPGETLAEKIKRDGIIPSYEIKPIIEDVLSGLNYLHSSSNPIVHNEITPDNIMLDLSSDIVSAKIIDLGYALHPENAQMKKSNQGLNPYFLATESIEGQCSPISDLFSLAATMYFALYGMPPWFDPKKKFDPNQEVQEDEIVRARKTPLIFPELSLNVASVDQSILDLLDIGLQENPKKRFQSADDFSKALKRNSKDENSLKADKNYQTKKTQITKADDSTEGGFKAIAGMRDLKAKMKLDVIDALNNPEEYARYGISIPNGILLYGPPGCGKTFFAKNFAQEVGFNFILAMPSTLKSKYVNGTQENIAEMFVEAEKNAPTVIFIDEINELLPSRDSEAHEMSKSAVNEMLAQMDRTGEKKILIIGATNYPNMIDSAMLRTGRLDKKFYISPPDFEARESLFEMSLKRRPMDKNIDFKKLSELTKNYVSSDIEFIVDEASRAALSQKSEITMEILENTILATPPSISEEELKKYEALIMEKSPPEKERKSIGFKR